MVLGAAAVLPEAWTWLAWDGDRSVALAGSDAEEDGQTGFGYVTAPDAHRQG